MKRGAGSVPEPFKLTKDEAGYRPLPKGLRPPPGKGAVCGTCWFMYAPRGSQDGGCFVVEGVVQKHALCNVWSVDGRKSLDFASGGEVALKLARLKVFLSRIHGLNRTDRES